MKYLCVKVFMVLFLTSLAIKLHFCFPSIPLSLRTVVLDGHLSFTDNEFAAKDFGDQYRYSPLAVLHPKSVSDISTIIKHVWQMGPYTELKIAARGRGHSLHGQSQANRGIVISMESLWRQKMQFHIGKTCYVDVSGGALWINILHESLKYGLTPKSWTDYLHLSVGGTLSNAGISGQAFRHGPQINNVHQLEVVTGKGEVVNCSESQNTDLFYGVLGGLGQFGVITRARISLQPAPHKVKWIRVLYSDFSTFSKDQEYLISVEKTFDYIEGLVIKNKTNLMNDWRSNFTPQDSVRASQFISEGKLLFCLELAKNFNPEETESTNKEIQRLLSQLSYISSTLFTTEVSYVEFLDRVHTSEIKLQSKGLWEVPHPWLNLFIPKSKINKFAQEAFGNLLKDTNNGPILVYPVNKSKWNNRTSLVLPDEDIIYLVAFLSHAVPLPNGSDSLDHILKRNKQILEFCESAQLGVKQYLPHYHKQEEWMHHFGPKWEVFAKRKSAYDPLALLAPGQRIFQNNLSYL
ncbi:hypothetical protein ACET3Z_002991 [Daucus carota]